jgi:hypothetical protein
VSIGDNRQLVDVLTAHHRKRLERWRLRLDRAELTRYRMTLAHSSATPLAVDAPYLIGCDQPSYLVISDNEVAANGRCATDIHRQDPGFVSYPGLLPPLFHGYKPQRP